MTIHGVEVIELEAPPIESMWQSTYAYPGVTKTSIHTGGLVHYTTHTTEGEEIAKEKLIERVILSLKY